MFLNESSKETARIGSNSEQQKDQNQPGQGQLLEQMMTKEVRKYPTDKLVGFYNSNSNTLNTIDANGTAKRVIWTVLQERDSLHLIDAKGGASTNAGQAGKAGKGDNIGSPNKANTGNSDKSELELPFEKILFEAQAETHAQADKVAVNRPAPSSLEDIRRRQMDPGVIKPYEPNFWGKVEEYIDSPSISCTESSGKVLLGLVYNIADQAHVYGTSIIDGPDRARRLNNSGVNRNEITDAGIETLLTFVPVGKFGKMLGIGKAPINASKFGQLHKGTRVLKGPHAQRGTQIRKHNQVIRDNNDFSSTYNAVDYCISLLTEGADVKQSDLAPGESVVGGLWVEITPSSEKNQP